MTELAELRTLRPSDLAKLELLPAGAVDIRRDLHHFMRYVAERGLLRTRRENAIPKTAARRLAKLLSYADETRAVEEGGCGLWSDHVSHVARELGLVTFDTEGEYVGYSSTAPSFPDNEVLVVDEAWRAYLKESPLAKETAILEAHLRMTENEFFHRATLVGGDRFETFGCATGPAGRMKLPEVRRGLLKLLAGLEPGLWYEMRDLVALLETSAPDLILDPSHRESKTRSGPRNSASNKPAATRENIYKNFREYPRSKNRWDRGAAQQITSKTPDAFRRVEGRYLEFFLCEIPFLCGFVDLAFRPPGGRRGRGVTPDFESLRAVRLTPRFVSIMRRDATFETVNVRALPDFEIIVEAASYPERVLDRLTPFCSLIREDAPIHRLKLEKRRVLEFVAANPRARPPADILTEIVGSPLPQNVAFEFSSWSRRGGSVVIFEEFGLVELPAGESASMKVLEKAGSVVECRTPEGFVLVREPERVFDALEAAHHVPVRVKHPEKTFARCPGRLGATVDKEKPGKGAKAKMRRPAKVRVESEDLVGYRASDAALVAELYKLLEGQVKTCIRVDDHRLIVSASELPRLRRALRTLSDRFDASLD